jgi:3D (Asp-Asp-Asp) domain-containing protein
MELRALYSVFGALILAVAFSSCSTQNSLSFMPGSDIRLANSKRSESARAKEIRESAPKHLVVRTTAYSHQERDSWKYGKSNAAGSTLKYGETERSAAADWSRYPVGTRFKIRGLSEEYVVEDYGSALVGSDTIDIYKPTLSSMRQWGTRHVGIEVLEWGSFSESERILKSRADKAEHVRQMLGIIQEKIYQIPEELWNGFSV